MNITSIELLDLEDCLCAELAAFISFKTHAIYFPPLAEEKKTVYVAAEKLLLAPIFWKQTYLGVLRLEGIHPGRIKRLLPVLGGLLSSLLENCLLKRLLREDLQTGLATEDEFFHFMENEAAYLETTLSQPQLSVRKAPLYRLCKGLIIFNWAEGARIAHEYDHGFYQHIFESLARTLKAILPKDAIGAVLGKFEGRRELGVIFNASGRNACHSLARELLKQLENLEFIDPLRDRKFHPLLYAGHALYPQDMQGEELRLPLHEQAVRLRDRARLGARAALQDAGLGNEKIMGFSRILRMGGLILADLGKGRYRINLGISVNAKVGMRFLLLGRQGKYWRAKGQMAILELGVMDSLAGIVSLERAGELPEKGDRLALLTSVSDWKEHKNIEENADCDDMQTETAVCGHAEFMERFQKSASNAASFTFGIARFIKNDAAIGESIHSILTSCKDNLADLLAPYGNNGLIFYIEGGNDEKTSSFLQKLAVFFENKDAGLQAGIFRWPYLNFNRSESEECALKALEYASLLPAPQIGYFNSMAITMGADRKFVLGDNYGALEDYRIALLADPHNAMARNSMGVCQAALGRYVDAVKNFEMALDDAEDRELLAKIHYNLAIARQKMNDIPRARLHYGKCLNNDKNHVFAWLRLGQLAEEDNDRAEARRCYICAASSCNADERIFNTAQRRLAYLESTGNEKEQARARLHDNLVRNPEDAASLLLLAQLYIDNNEDPALAEMLIRKSLNIHSCREAWDSLARILETQNRWEDAEKARDRGRHFK